MIIRSMDEVIQSSTQLSWNRHHWPGYGIVSPRQHLQPVAYAQERTTTHLHVVEPAVVVIGCQQIAVKPEISPRICLTIGSSPFPDYSSSLRHVVEPPVVELADFAFRQLRVAPPLRILHQHVLNIEESGSVPVNWVVRMRVVDFGVHRRCCFGVCVYKGP
ncbi:hypothetical protein Mapa_015521 [Marchantia paleacea]|nr:hypothetical protein Mapa_015521 [Marchantia paleacea]